MNSKDPTIKKHCFFLYKKKTRCLTALPLIKCLKQIKYQRLHLTLVPILKLSSSISTMVNIYKWI